MKTPPYHISSEILGRLVSISQKLGVINALHLEKPSARLRRENRIKTLHSSLSIEGNTLSEDQVTALFDNSRVIGPKKDILEVTNAIEVYSKLHSFNPTSTRSMLKAHSMLMKNLVRTPGKFQTGEVGIVKGSKVAHMAPPNHLVPGLIKELLSYLESHTDPEIIKSCVFHYELEFIHPFDDGNGRMGRLWQTLILMTHNPVFEFLPIEHLIKHRQEDYYQSLSQSDKSGSSTVFIEFMLGVIDASLESLIEHRPANLTWRDRIDLFKTQWSQASFVRKDYLRAFKTISTATASRDLKQAVENNLLDRQGDKRLTIYYWK